MILQRLRSTFREQQDLRLFFGLTRAGRRHGRRFHIRIETTVNDLAFFEHYREIELLSA